jgi:hypothetical protein
MGLPVAAGVPVVVRLMAYGRGRNTRLSGLLTARKLVREEKRHWEAGTTVERACARLVEQLDLLVRLEWKKTHRGARKV